MPSGCSFWRLAANGRTFYTLPEHHFNCALEAYTHNISLSADREKETEQTLAVMFELGYVRPEEVPEIPRLANRPKAILYAPLGDARVAPDVVCRSNVAVRSSGACGCRGCQAGRPTCMATGCSHRTRNDNKPGLHREPRIHGSR